jgi:DNA polymerase III alpha subunit
MTYDQYGQCWTNCDELVDLLYQDPDLKLDNFLVKDLAGATQYNSAVEGLYADLPKLRQLRTIDATVEEFDQQLQNNWYMPDEYKTLDIADHVLKLCNNEAELQRCGEELLIYQERELFDLLRYLKYLVDVMKQNNIVWGVGRGSSVASFVLYKLEVHRINSLYYNLDVAEFLR